MTAEQTLEERIEALEARVDPQELLGEFAGRVQSLESRAPEDHLASNTLTLNAEGRVEESISELPPSVQSAAQFLVNIQNHGAVSGQDCTAAIEAAQAEAEELGANYGVFFPPGTWLYDKTLIYRVPWLGVPRKSLLKRTSTFTYEGFENQFSVVNAHASTTYNPATADTVIVRGIDFEIEGTEVAGKGAFGLANVAGGELWDCHFKTNGTNVVGALVDLYACVKNVKLDVVCENLTQAKTGGNWIRNLAAKPAEAGQTTENIYISPRSRFVTTTGDEALAIYGVFGLVKGVLVDRATLEGGASTESHQRLGSTFPSALAEQPHAAIEDIEWRKCTFIDVEGTIKEAGEVLGFGRGTGITYQCQNIRQVDCTYWVKATKAKVVICRNIPSKYEGANPGIKAIRPYINAEGSPEPIAAALEEYPTVEGGTTVGNILTACKRCNTISGGSWEATEKVYFDCNSVGGDYRVTIPNATGIAFYREANTGEWSGVASYGKGEITGGKQLLVVHNTVEAGNIINLRGATMSPAAEEGNVIETPTAGSIPTVNLTANLITGPKALKIKGTIAQADGNTWYGTLEARGALLTAAAQTYTTGPAEALYELTVAGGGGGGGGGGASAKEGGNATQVGGGGGGTGQVVTKVQAVAANTTLTVDEIGAGGKPGKGGAASTNTEGHAGEAAGTGGASKLKGAGVSITATGGKGGAGALANSATNVNGGAYGAQGGLTGGVTTAPVGWGGVANSATGFAGGQAMGVVPRAGGGGAPASATEGGSAGSSGSLSTKTGTKNGGHPEAAPANTGQGGDGGGGGAPAGEGGEGGEGASGFVLIRKVSP
jgi:hypothetical protein